jgi:hypothetical protein
VDKDDKKQKAELSLIHSQLDTCEQQAENNAVAISHIIGTLAVAIGSILCIVLPYLAALNHLDTYQLDKYLLLTLLPLLAWTVKMGMDSKKRAKDDE